MSFDHFCQQYCAPADSPVAIDYSRMGFSNEWLAGMEARFQNAFTAMEQLEAGAIANPDEQRMVGHYWLRDLSRIPDRALSAEVESENRRANAFVQQVHSGALKGERGTPFKNLLSIGIGGSALGPQFIADALGRDAADRMKPYFLDNTDPEGIQRVLDQLKGALHETLCVVISKSGGTPETRNGMLLAEAAWKEAGLQFGRHAVAITGAASQLDRYAADNKWLARLPMYDWVGGRTSVMSAVGVVPLSLQGIDTEAFLRGAKVMDEATRVRVVTQNPAAILAACWFHATGGRGEKDMVVLPYKDRLLLFSRYLQQLIMESIGKELDLSGKKVEQGISVYGNKGSTDQHAYIQQLRDGVNNFFAVFLEVLVDGGSGKEVEPGVTAGDYLSGFFLGTRTALSDKGRANMTITVERVTPFTVGALVALFERAVGLYASLVNINAYHQPGVEAGKKAAATVLKVQAQLLAALHRSPRPRTAPDWAKELDADPELCFRVLQHLAANGRATQEGRLPSEAAFGSV